MELHHVNCMSYDIILLGIYSHGNLPLSLRKDSLQGYYFFHNGAGQNGHLKENHLHVLVIQT